jgi:hypothetical protein
LRHRCLVELEVEQRRVLDDARIVSRLGQHDEALLNAPTQQHLRRCPPDRLSDCGYDRVLQALSAGEGAIRLHNDVGSLTELDRRPSLQEGRQLDLVDGCTAIAEQFLQVGLSSC